MSIEITWDETKRLANLDKHGFDFADLSFEFFLSSRIAQAREGRFIAIGPSKDGEIAVVFAALGTQGLAVISMRPASRRERNADAKHI